MNQIQKKYFIEYYFTLPNVLQFIPKFDNLEFTKKGVLNLSQKLNF